MATATQNANLFELSCGETQLTYSDSPTRRSRCTAWRSRSRSDENWAVKRELLVGLGIAAVVVAAAALHRLVTPVPS